MSAKKKKFPAALSPLLAHSTPRRQRQKQNPRENAPISPGKEQTKQTETVNNYTSKKRARQDGNHPFRGETEETVEANRTQLTTNQLAPTNKKKPTTANQKATSASPASRLRLTSVSLASHLRLTSVSFAPTILGATPYKSRRCLLPKYRLTHPAPTHPCEGRLLHPKQRPDPHPKT